MPDTNKQQSLKAMAEELWQARPQHNIYLLLNPHRPVADDHPLHPDKLWITEGERRTFVKRPDFDWLHDVCPILVQIAGPSIRWPFNEMDAVYETAIAEAGHANGAYVCGWIASTASITKVASQLAHSLSTPAGILPLFEPLRLERLAATVETEWLDQWLNKIDAWVFVSADGRPLQIQNKDTAPTDKVLRWTDDAVQAQTRINTLQRCLTAWKNIQPQLPEQSAKRADTALIEAQQLGLNELEDQLYCALLALTFKPDWHQHSSAQKAIQQARQQPGTLADIIAALPEAALQAIGLSTAEPQGIN